MSSNKNKEEALQQHAALSPAPPSVPQQPSTKKKKNHKPKHHQKKKTQRKSQFKNVKNLQEQGMATALSIDYWSAPDSSSNALNCKSDPHLSVNFICMHPPPPEDGDDETTESSSQKPSALTSNKAQTAASAPPPRATRRPPNKAVSARFQEIFIDYLNMKCCNINASSKHILDDRFDSFLQKGERDFKDALVQFLNHGLSDEARATQANQVLMNVLEDKLGYKAGLNGQKSRNKANGKARVPIFSSKYRNEKRDVLDEKGRIRRLSKQREQIISSEQHYVKSTEFAEKKERKIHCQKKSAGNTHTKTKKSLDCNEYESDNETITKEDNKKKNQEVQLKKALSFIRQRCDPKLLSQLYLSNIDTSTLKGQQQLKSHLLQILNYHYRQQASSPAANPSPSIQELQYIQDIINNPFTFSTNTDDEKQKIMQQQQIIQKSGLLKPPGHVFVCNASICNLYCDAFLMPGAISKNKSAMNGSIWSQWFHSTFFDSSGKCKNEKLREKIDPYQFKRYEKYGSIATHQHWPWSEFEGCQGDNKGRKSGDGSPDVMVPVPFPVMGEVSFDRLKAIIATTSTGTRKTGKNKSPPVSAPSKLPTEEQHINALMATVRQFIEVALHELRTNQSKPLARRERYLLAIPVIGTGGAQAGDLTGQVIESLLHVMADYASMENDVDLVLVCADEATHAHAQSIRSQLIMVFDKVDDDDLLQHSHYCSPPTAMSFTTEEENNEMSSSPLFPCFAWMTQEMRDYALQLAKMASSGHLALFLGAGISIGSGLPGWFDLLHTIEDLFTPNGTEEERKLGNSTKWDPLVMANLLDGICISRSDQNGVRKNLKQRICDYISIRAQYPCLLLSLLSSLPCQQMVTQNYDRLIEKSFECWNIADPSSRHLSVIPYQPKRNSHHWLLKMHGCITSPDDIIITGDDYGAFETSSRYKALGGLVQASLMTKHLLFVGFSLTDPNYLKIVKQVRDALRNAADDEEATEEEEEEDAQSGYLKRSSVRDRTV